MSYQLNIMGAGLSSSGKYLQLSINLQKAVGDRLVQIVTSSSNGTMWCRTSRSPEYTQIWPRTSLFEVGEYELTYRDDEGGVLTWVQFKFDVYNTGTIYESAVCDVSSVSDSAIGSLYAGFPKNSGYGVYYKVDLSKQIPYKIPLTYGEYSPPDKITCTSGGKTFSLTPHDPQLEALNFTYGHHDVIFTLERTSGVRRLVWGEFHIRPPLEFNERCYIDLISKSQSEAYGLCIAVVVFRDIPRKERQLTDYKQFYPQELYIHTTDASGNPNSLHRDDYWITSLSYGASGLSNLYAVALDALELTANRQEQFVALSPEVSCLIEKWQTPEITKAGWYRFPDVYNLSLKDLLRGTIRIAWEDTTGSYLHATSYKISLNGKPFDGPYSLTATSSYLYGSKVIPKGKYSEICIRIFNTTYGLSQTLQVVDFEIK